MTGCLSSPFLAHVGAAKPDNAKGDATPVSVGTKRKKEPEEPPKKKKKIGRQEPMKGRPRSYKLRMFPTKAQAFELKRCFAAARAAYNFANRRVRVDKVPVNEMSLKHDWVIADPALKRDAMGVSARITNGGVADLVRAYTSNYAKLRIGKGKPFVVKDRDEIKTKTEVIHIERVKVLLGVVKSTAPQDGSQRRRECGLRFGNNLKALGPIRIQGRRRIVETIERNGAYLPCEAKIQWDKRLGVFYYIWVDDVPFKDDPDPQFKDKWICSLDPGVSPIQEFYSPAHGEHGALMVNLREEIKRRCLAIDGLCSRLKRRDRAKCPMQYETKRARGCPSHKKRRKRGHTKRALRKKMRREHRRLHGMVEAAHYDAANFLLGSYDLIIAPILNTCRLAHKGERRLFGSRMARALYTCSHRLFRQRLAFAAHRYPGAYVFECSEPGTSKTCTHCGAWKHDLRLGDKLYHCPHCNVSVDRQLAGARNNFFAAYGMAVGVGWDGKRG